MVIKVWGRGAGGRGALILTKVCACPPPPSSLVPQQ